MKLEPNEYARRVKDNSLYSVAFSKLIRNLSASVRSSTIPVDDKSLILKFFDPLIRVDTPPPQLDLVQIQCPNPVPAPPVRDLSKLSLHATSNQGIDIGVEPTAFLDEDSGDPSTSWADESELELSRETPDSGILSDVLEVASAAASALPGVGTVINAVRTGAKIARVVNKRKASPSYSSSKSRKVKTRVELIDMPKKVGHKVKIDECYFLGEDPSNEMSHEHIEERRRKWRLHSSGCVACDYISTFAFPSMMKQPSGQRFRQLVFFHKHCDDLDVSDLYRRACGDKNHWISQQTPLTAQVADIV
jgi:hypothetical protein